MLPRKLIGRKIFAIYTKRKIKAIAIFEIKRVLKCNKNI